jgi:hypothetical protein
MERFPIRRTKWGDELGRTRNGEEEDGIIMVLRMAGVTAQVTVALETLLPLRSVFYCRNDIR